MKTRSFLAMSMMALLAAGCSSDEITVDNDGGNGGAVDGKAFVAVNINLPTANGSRATENNFDKGDAVEYAVKNVTVTYYGNEDGTNPKFTRTYTESQLTADTPGTTINGISRIVTLPAEEVPFSGTVYALVEINNNAGLTVSPTNAPEPSTAADLANATNGFFMTNAPRHDGKYLAPVTTQPTQKDAEDNASSNPIYVERAVAKVQVDVKTSETGWNGNTFTVQSGVNKNAEVTLNGWKLDVTNTMLFPIRKFNTTTFGSTDYARFYGAQAWRTYWAEDPNYRGTVNADDFTKQTDATKITNTVGYGTTASAVEYCLENTFDVANQKQDETTRVLIKATYKPEGWTGTDWYALTGSPKAYTADGIKSLIKDALGLTNSEEITLAMANGGKYDIAAKLFSVDGTEADATQAATVAGKLGASISYYKGGVCYYPVRIKHMAELCPWGGESTSAPQFGTPGTPYIDYTTDTTNDMEKAYLGRYGVVRNNWYKISIKSISQPGSPSIPTPESRCDDEHNYWLDAEINILDWALRSQEVEL